MRLAFFGSSGDMALLPLEVVAERHEVVAVVRADGRRAGWRRSPGAIARALGLLRRDPLAAWAHRRGIPCVSASRRDDPRVLARLSRLQPDLFLVSAFRCILGRQLLALPRRGALNLHASLLPRHRGPVPWFWVYHCDDRETGVTVHWMTDRVDAGDIVGQAAAALERGLSVDRLGERCARQGAGLLAAAVASVEAGTAARRVQDEANATPAPCVAPGSRMVDFSAWGAERVWHFLTGLYPRHREPLFDDAGRAIRYGGVRGFELTPEGRRPVGRVTPDARGLALHCRDGLVWLDAGTAG